MMKLIAAVCAGIIGLGPGNGNSMENTCEKCYETWKIIETEVETVKREEGGDARVSNFKDEYRNGKYVITCDVEGYWYEWDDEEECLIGDYRKTETLMISYDKDGMMKVVYEY